MGRSTSRKSAGTNSIRKEVSKWAKHEVMESEFAALVSTPTEYATACSRTTRVVEG